MNVCFLSHDVVIPFCFHFLLFSKLSTFNDTEGLMNIEIEYERIQETIHTEPVRYAGTLQHNRQKNRFHNVIPCESISHSDLIVGVPAPL